MSDTTKSALVSASENRQLTPVEQVFYSRHDQLEAALPQGLTPEKFISTLNVAAIKEPKLRNAPPAKLFLAGMQCASDGLLPDGKEAALLAFGNDVTYVPMIRGIYKLVRNSGDVRNLNAVIVRRGDEFRLWVDETGERFHYERNLDDEHDGPESIRGCLAYATLSDGTMLTEYMSRAQIEKRRRVSRSRGGPWTDWYEEMAQKTVVHRLSRRLPLSAAALQAVNRVEQHYDFSRAVERPRPTLDAFDAPTPEEPRDTPDTSFDVESIDAEIEQ